MRPTRSRSAAAFRPTTIRRIAAELAHVAFEQTIELPVAWTDWAGRRHETMQGPAGRRCTPCAASRPIPTAFTPAAPSTCCRCCSARSTCPAASASSRPTRSSAPPGPKPAGKDGGKPMTPLDGMPLGFVCGPEDLLVDEDGTPLRIDKAYSWEAPLAAHGLMHMVIRNAWARRSLPDRHAVHVHGEHGLELVDEHRRDHRHADRQGRGGQLQDPLHHLFRRLLLRDGAFADLVLPDTTYLERHDCISLLDRPISHADGPGDAIRQPVVEPDRDVRPFQSVLIDLGARLGLPGFVDDDGAAEIPRLCRLHRQPRAHAGHRPARRLARRGRRRRSARASPTPTSCSATSTMAASGTTTSPTTSATTRWPTAPISTSRCRWASSPRPSRSSSSSIPSRCSASASPRAAMARCCRRRASAQRIETYFDPLPFWYRRSKRRPSTCRHIRCTR